MQRHWAYAAFSFHGRGDVLKLFSIYQLSCGHHVTRPSCVKTANQPTNHKKRDSKSDVPVRFVVSYVEIINGMVLTKRNWQRDQLVLLDNKSVKGRDWRVRWWSVSLNNNFALYCKWCTFDI